MFKLFLISLGGAIGTGARYLITVGSVHFFGATFPYGTWIVNLAGSFLMGFLMQFELASDFLPVTTRIFLATGVLGGFTTYSSFNYEVIRYFQNGHYGKGMFYLFFMLLSCFAAGFIGLILAKKLTGI